MKLLLSLSAFALTACATVPTAASPTAGLAQTAQAGLLRVRPLAVIEDSRCPINALCVWAGRLIVRAEVEAAGRRTTHDMTMGVATPVTGGTLTLVSGQPGKQADVPNDPAAYRFTFAFQR